MASILSTARILGLYTGPISINTRKSMKESLWPHKKRGFVLNTTANEAQVISVCVWGASCS
jgi:hypothetical protein